MVEIKVDTEKCTGCGTCVDVCPVGVYEIVDGKSSP
ncbi:ferredoxin, partial [Candidatus Bathyarchaeota archaeon]